MGLVLLPVPAAAALGDGSGREQDRCGEGGGRLHTMSAEPAVVLQLLLGVPHVLFLFLFVLRLVVAAVLLLLLHCCGDDMACGGDGWRAGVAADGGAATKAGGGA